MTVGVLGFRAPVKATTMASQERALIGTWKTDPSDGEAAKGRFGIEESAVRYK